MNKMHKIRSGRQLAKDSFELLRTKLTPPQLRGPLVERKGLFAYLDEAIERSITLLSAPAGFGKTTLVRAWTASHSGQENFPSIAWVLLDEDDNSPVRFWRYILTACQTFQEGLGDLALDMLCRSHQPSLETVLTLFINELTRFAGRGVLVLEDYHVINSPRVHETLAFLLDYLPETLRLILITRSDPPLPLARWRAHHDLYELRTVDLRFSLEETGTFLQQTLAFPVASELVASLDGRIEGWVAGLRLLALAVQGRQTQQEIEQVLTTFTGSHQHILEYLVADVLAAQPEQLQTFLLSTSLFSRITGSLCNAVLGRDDGVLVLALLDHANLFLYRLGGDGQWYRYHALFAEAMQHEAGRRLGEETLRSLYHKASLWYEEHNLLIEAVEAEIETKDFARVADLMEPVITRWNFQNEYYTLLRWFERLPEENLPKHPSLCLAYATALLFMTDRHAPVTRVLVEKPLQMAERVWREEGNLARLGEVEALRAACLWWQGDFLQSFMVARRALELLPEEAAVWRGICLIHTGSAELFAGRPGPARQILMDARQANEAAGNSYGLRASQFVLCEASLAQGELRLTAQVYQQLVADALDSNDITDVGAALFRLAMLDYEWNNLESAQERIDQVLKMDRRVVEDDLLVGSLLTQARLQYARGEKTQVFQDLTALAAQMQRWPHLLREIHLCQAGFALSDGDLVAALQQASAALQYSDANIFIYQERDALLNARLLNAQGKASEALCVLADWQEEAQARGRTRSFLEILCLQARVYAAQKQMPQARQALLQALTLARPEGYQRLFLDEGETLCGVLRGVLPEIREEALSSYALGLLRAFERGIAGSQTATSPAASSTSLIEALSPQERRVLRLLAAGLSNPEIARELVVSINTIKTQVQSIYYKLDVNSRQEARESARRLRLL